MDRKQLYQEALDTLHTNTTLDTPIALGVSATPVSGNSMCSSLSDKELEYIDYKLNQYMREEEDEREQQQRTKPPFLRRLARKVKDRISRVFRPQRRGQEPELGYFSSWIVNFPTDDGFYRARRHGMEIETSERQTLGAQLDLARIEGIFSRPGSSLASTQERTGVANTSTHGSSEDTQEINKKVNHEATDDYQVFLRDGPTKAKPSFVENTSTFSTDGLRGAFVLEAAPLTPKTPLSAPIVGQRARSRRQG